MSILYILVPVAILLALAGILAFRWAVRSGQFDDVQTPAIRILLDDEMNLKTKSDPSSPTPDTSHRDSVESGSGKSLSR